MISLMHEVRYTGPVTEEPWGRWFPETLVFRSSNMNSVEGLCGLIVRHQKLIPLLA